MALALRIPLLSGVFQDNTGVSTTAVALSIAGVQVGDVIVALVSSDTIISGGNAPGLRNSISPGTWTGQNVLVLDNGLSNTAVFSALWKVWGPTDGTSVTIAGGCSIEYAIFVISGAASVTIPAVNGPTTMTGGVAYPIPATTATADGSWLLSAVGDSNPSVTFNPTPAGASQVAKLDGNGSALILYQRTGLPVGPSPAQSFTPVSNWVQTVRSAVLITPAVILATQTPFDDPWQWDETVDDDWWLTLDAPLSDIRVSLTDDSWVWDEYVEDDWYDDATQMLLPPAYRRMVTHLAARASIWHVDQRLAFIHVQPRSAIWHVDLRPSFTHLTPRSSVWHI